ncbi:MAG: hypothetical protein PHP35_00155 [Candidatus Colwellbacteria bacterium]|nr:hypothetical protein [Candidatus Colwellbacteria bacterium]
MEPISLKEYRCVCGKLLFKGLLSASVVEIKCKRCARIMVFKDAEPPSTPASFTLTINQEGVIIDACRGAEVVLCYSRKELIGMPVSAVCPAINEPVNDNMGLLLSKEDAPYRIKSNMFLSKRGKKIDGDGYFIKADEADSIYRMFGYIE